MSAVLTGGVLGAAVAVGSGLVLTRLWALRRVSLESRVGPWLHDTGFAESTMTRVPSRSQSEKGIAGGVLGLLLTQAAGGVEAVLGGAAATQRRLDRAASPLDLQGFRIEQVQWGFVALALAAVWQSLGFVTGGGNIISALAVCSGGFVTGVLARERRLSSAADDRDREVLAEFPVVAELLALAVASGEGPVGALDRVVRRSHGALSEDLARVLAQIRTGTPVARAFEEMSARSAVPAVARFAQGVAVAVDRGTPLADVLHAQAADVREVGRRRLIESAARREIYMLAPVVFLVLPVTILFAFFPGLIGLRLTAP